MHVHGAGLDIRLRLPDRLEQLGARLHAIAPLDQSLEELELGGGELDLLALGGHAMRRAIEHDGAPDEPAAGGDGGSGETPQNRADAQHQLFR